MDPQLSFRKNRRCVTRRSLSDSATETQHFRSTASPIPSHTSMYSQRSAHGGPDTLIFLGKPPNGSGFTNGLWGNSFAGLLGGRSWAACNLVVGSLCSDMSTSCLCTGSRKESSLLMRASWDLWYPEVRSQSQRVRESHSSPRIGFDRFPAVDSDTRQRIRYGVRVS